LIRERRARKFVWSLPRQLDSHHFNATYCVDRIELEIVPQGNVAARIQAAGAGLGAICTSTGYGTLLAEGIPDLRRRFRALPIGPGHSDAPNLLGFDGGEHPSSWKRTIRVRSHLFPSTPS
jgi:acyl CoA:acetate/3-ketoacid CoA transferase alpha subunit